MAVVDTRPQRRPQLSRRDLPWQFWVLLGGLFISRVGWFVVPFLSYYLTHARHVGVGTVGHIVAAFGAGSMLGQPVGGWLADRLGRRSAIVGSLAATSVTYLALGAARDVPTMALLALAAGTTYEMARPAISSLITDLVPARLRSRAFGLSYWVINVGSGCAGILGGLLASYDYGSLFMIDAAMCIAFAVVIAFVRGGKTSGPDPSAEEGRAGYLRVLRDPILIAFTLITLVAMCVFYQEMTALPLVMGDKGIGPRSFGMVCAANAISVVLLQPFVQQALNRLPALVVAAAGCAVLGVGMGLTGLAHTSLQFALTVVAWVPGEIAVYTACAMVIAEIAPAGLRGRYNGIWGVGFSAAGLVAPLVGTWTLDNAGAAALWIGCVIAGLAAGAGCVALMPAMRRRAVPHS